MWHQSYALVDDHHLILLHLIFSLNCFFQLVFLLMIIINIILHHHLTIMSVVATIEECRAQNILSPFYYYYHS